MTTSGGPPAPLILLPGLICNELVWASQVEALSEFRPTAVGGDSKYTKSGLQSEQLARYKQRLESIMLGERLYLKPNLTLPALAEAVGAGGSQQVTSRLFDPYCLLCLAGFLIGFGLAS